MGNRDRLRWLTDPESVRLVAEQGRVAALEQADRDAELRARYGDDFVDDPWHGLV